MFLCSLIVLCFFLSSFVQITLFCLSVLLLIDILNQCCSICCLSLVNFQCGHQESFYSFSSALMPNLVTHFKPIFHFTFIPYQTHTPLNLSLSSFPESHFSILCTLWWSATSQSSPSQFPFLHLLMTPKSKSIVLASFW